MTWRKPHEMREKDWESGKISTKEVREILNVSTNQFRTMKRIIGVKPNNNRFFYIQHCPFKLMLLYFSIRKKYPSFPVRWAALKALEGVSSKMDVAEYVLLLKKVTSDTRPQNLSRKRRNERKRKLQEIF